MKNPALSLLVAALLWMQMMAGVSARSRQGILHASLRDESGGGGGGGGGGHHYRNFCIKFYPQVYNLSRRLEDASVFDLSSLLDVSSAADDVNTCSEGHQLDALDGRVALVADRRENCSISQRAELAQEHGALALLAAPSAATTPPRSSNATSVPSSIPVAALFFSDSRGDLMSLARENPGGTFALYSPDEPPRDLDASIFIIFLMAVFTVGVGSLWSGYTKHYLRLQKSNRRLNDDSAGDRSGGGPGGGGGHNGAVPVPHAEGAGAEAGGKSGGGEEDLSVRVTPVLVFFFVACMCAMLVLLYLFFDKLVYVIIGMFVMASIIATYSCFEPFVMWTYRVVPSCPTVQLPRCNFYLFSLHMELRQFVLFVLSVALSVVWVVFRKEDWAWVLQDILGILFSINMLKVLRLPSFKICTILLSILFIYDIFFVFITPHLTSDGKSVMVEVATGGTTGEQLPMVLKVPHMGHNPYNVCWIPYSMLGFGDILVPGLLLSYCHSYDLLKSTPWKAYWTLSYICYWLSLVVCFAGLFLMDNAQPALLYIVPGTLVPAAALALVRGEFMDFWGGDGGGGAGREHDDEEEDEEEGGEEGEEHGGGGDCEQAEEDGVAAAAAAVVDGEEAVDPARDASKKSLLE